MSFAIKSVLLAFRSLFFFLIMQSELTDEGAAAEVHSVDLEGGLEGVGVGLALLAVPDAAGGDGLGGLDPGRGQGGQVGVEDGAVHQGLGHGL